MKLIAMIFAIILSAYLGIICWKHRPQMTAADAAPGLNEEKLADISGKLEEPRRDPIGVQEADQS